MKHKRTISITAFLFTFLYMGFAQAAPEESPDTFECPLNHSLFERQPAPNRLILSCLDENNRNSGPTIEWFDGAILEAAIYRSGKLLLKQSFTVGGTLVYFMAETTDHNLHNSIIKQNADNLEEINFKEIRENSKATFIMNFISGELDRIRWSESFSNGDIMHGTTNRLLDSDIDNTYRQKIQNILETVSRMELPKYFLPMEVKRFPGQEHPRLVVAR